jgi:opacity protein-like surface antigen
MRLDDRLSFALLMVVALLFFNASYHAAAQQPQQAQSKCPTVDVACPDSVTAGGKVTISAKVSGGDTQVTPTYNWTVSAGYIESGQGTSTIVVNTDEVAGDSSVTATVELGGFARECVYSSTVDSCTTSVMKKIEARKLDEYGTLKPAEENSRLDNFGIELQNDPTAQGYIIAYGGRANKPGDAKKAAGKARDYLVSKRGLDAQRVVVVDGGRREQPSLELWIVPSGAEPPQPTPTIKPDAAKPASPAKATEPKSTTGRRP